MNLSFKPFSNHLYENEIIQKKMKSFIWLMKMLQTAQQKEVKAKTKNERITNPES